MSKSSLLSLPRELFRIHSRKFWFLWTGQIKCFRIHQTSNLCMILIDFVFILWYDDNSIEREKEIKINLMRKMITILIFLCYLWPKNDNIVGAFEQHHYSGLIVSDGLFYCCWWHGRWHAHLFMIHIHGMNFHSFPAMRMANGGGLFMHLQLFRIAKLRV